VVEVDGVVVGMVESGTVVGVAENNEIAVGLLVFQASDRFCEGQGVKPLDGMAEGDGVGSGNIVVGLVVGFTDGVLPTK